MTKLLLKMREKKPIILYRGVKFTVECAIRKNGSSESKVFLDSLSKTDRAKIFRIIKRYADIGHIYNKQQFKKVEGKIWEFKHYQTRILMYNCGKQRIALTHGYQKKVKRIPRKEIERANQIMNEYEEIKKGETHGKE